MMRLEYLIEDLIDTLEERLADLKNLNKCDVELYTQIWGDEEKNHYINTLNLALIEISNAIEGLVDDIAYESSGFKKSNFDDNHEPLPKITEWVMDTLNNIDVNSKSSEQVYNQVFSKLADNDNGKKVMISKIFIDHFIDEEFRWDTDHLIDALDVNINAMLNIDDYQQLLDFIDSIPFQMPKYNLELEDQEQEYFSVSDRIATGLVYELQPITDMIMEYVNSKDLDTNQEEDYDM